MNPRHWFRRLTHGLRGQLLLATTVPVVALLLIVSVVAALGFTRMTQAMVRSRDAEIVQLAAQQVADYWSETVLLLSQTASTSQVRQGQPEVVRGMLAVNGVLNERFDQVAVTDAGA